MNVDVNELEREHARRSLYGEIDAERRRQDGQWGGPEHDDQHDSAEWGNFIARQLGKDATIRNRYQPGTPEFTAERRERLVKIAALAVAGIEAIDRQVPGEVV